ncbi:MAG: GDSL-type esterase/lipase family protein [Blastocatellia bacterium]|nr:GDSL-type esterase/lipase family protein [Blastocatellia bacterium]
MHYSGCNLLTIRRKRRKIPSASAAWSFSFYLIIAALRNGAALSLLTIVCLTPLYASSSTGAVERQGSLDNPFAQQPIEDPEGHALSNFYQALMRIEDGEAAIARIVHYGDSHVAADILTGALRRKFQSGFGDAGLGFVLAGQPWTWYGRKGLTSQASPGWQVDGLSASSLMKDGRRLATTLGLAGLSLTAYEAGEWLRLGARCSRFDIYLLKQPGGARLDVLLDGVVYHRRVSLDSERVEPFYLEVTAYTEGFHSVEIRSASPGPVRVFGAAIERNLRGVVYDAMGINGATARRPLLWDWRTFTDNLQRRAPDLIVIAYGSNEAGDEYLDLARYGEEFYTLLIRLRKAVPRASLLVISPPDRAARAGARWRTISLMPALVRAQKRAAEKAGAAFWDMFQAMGGEGSISTWATLPVRLAQPDRVHLTRAGYARVAESLYAELMRGYLWALLGGAKTRERGVANAAVSYWLGNDAGRLDRPSRLRASRSSRST